MSSGAGAVFCLSCAAASSLAYVYVEEVYASEMPQLYYNTNSGVVSYSYTMTIEEDMMYRAVFVPAEVVLYEVFLNSRTGVENTKEILQTATLVCTTGLRTEIRELREQFDTLANLKWRAMIDHVLAEAAKEMRGKADDEIDEIVTVASEDIAGYINGTNTDYIIVSFGGEGGQAVRVPDKISQQMR